MTPPSSVATVCLRLFAARVLHAADYATVTHSNRTGGDAQFPGSLPAGDRRARCPVCPVAMINIPARRWPAEDQLIEPESGGRGGRCPNTAEPIRTMVAPSAIAAAKSPLMPMDNSVADSAPG